LNNIKQGREKQNAASLHKGLVHKHLKAKGI
jgi:hypothetical protein